jgi:hypothetical protein
MTLEQLKNGLEGVDKAQLIAILLGFAEKDRHIRDELSTRFSGETKLLKSVREMIKSSIKSAMRHGFVEYNDVGMAVEGAERALDIAVSRINAGDFLTAVSVCIEILRGLVNELGDCDDSDGIAGDIIDKAVRLIQDSAKNNQDNGALFELIFNHAAETIYDDWDDWRFEMLKACIPFCADPLQRKRMEKYLGSFRTEWTSNRAQHIRHNIIRQFDGDNAANIYLEKNIKHNEDFRSIAIEKAIAAKNYDRALQLCLDGERKNKKKHAGKVHIYQHKRYTIYKKQKDISGQRELVRAFVLDGDFDYYTKLKALYTQTEWPAVLAGLIETLESTRYTSQVYIDICIYEHFREKLLAICKKKPAYLIELYPHLVPQYAAELAPIFTAGIRKAAAAAGGRSGYQQVCKYIRHYIKACGKPDAKKLVAKLRETYCRRTAFLDELRKITV